MGPSGVGKTQSLLWPALAKDTALTAALLDRLLHHATILNIQGESFRLKDKQKAGIIPARIKKDEQNHEP